MIWIVVLLIIVILLFAPLRADISFLLLEGENRLCVRAGIAAPFITVYDSSRKQKSKERKAQNKEKEEDIDSGNKKKKISFKDIKEVLNLALDIFGFLKKRLKIEFLKLHFHIGLDDAAQTGIVTGSAWGFLYDFVSICDRQFKLKKHSVHVSPDFTQEVFETDINIKVSFRLIYAITVAIKFLKGMKKL